MSKMASITINLSKAQQSGKIFMGKKINPQTGAADQYISLVVSIDNEVDTYGNNCAAMVSQTQEERAGGAPKQYLGNGRVFWSDGQNEPVVNNDNVDQLKSISSRCNNDQSGGQYGQSQGYPQQSQSNGFGGGQYQPAQQPQPGTFAGGNGGGNQFGVPQGMSQPQQQQQQFAPQGAPQQQQAPQFMPQQQPNTMPSGAPIPEMAPPINDDLPF